MGEKRKRKEYTDEQRAEYCELAQHVGIGAAIRELGYPTYPTAMVWLEQRGVEPKKIDIMAKAREFHQYYKAEDMLKVIDEAMAVVTEMYSTARTADDAVKLANAISKLVSSRQMLEGKATSIIEKREMSQMDLEVIELLNAQKSENKMKEMENKTQIQTPKEK